jgi:hypothetical protein
MPCASKCSPLKLLDRGCAIRTQSLWNQIVRRITHRRPRYSRPFFSRRNLFAAFLFLNSCGLILTMRAYNECETAIKVVVIRDFVFVNPIKIALRHWSREISDVKTLWIWTRHFDFGENWLLTGEQKRTDCALVLAWFRSQHSRIEPVR